MLDLVMQSIASGIAVGCIYGLIGIGFCVIYNASGIVNFAQGAFVMLGGMMASAALKTYGIPLPLAGILAIAICAGIGMILERIVVRPLWDRQSATFVMILATLAAQIVIERLTLIVAGDQPRSLPMFTDLPPLRIGRHCDQLPVPLDCRRCGAGYRRCSLFSSRRQKPARRCGRVPLIGMRQRLLGIPVSRMLALAFGLSAALGAFAGVLITPTQYTSFNLGVPFAISGFIAAIVGGFGRPLGALAGGIFLGIVQALAIVALGSAFKNIAALSILLLFLFFRPTGLLGSAK